MKQQYINGQHYFYHWGYWCVATKMQFVIEGIKAKFYREFIPEVDLLVDTRKSIRARQRQKITNIRFDFWCNISEPTGKKYNRALLMSNHIFAN